MEMEVLFNTWCDSCSRNVSCSIEIVKFHLTGGRGKPGGMFSKFTFKLCAACLKEASELVDNALLTKLNGKI